MLQFKGSERIVDATKTFVAVGSSERCGRMLRSTGDEKTTKRKCPPTGQGDPEKHVPELRKQLPPEIHPKMLPTSRTIDAPDVEGDAHGRRKGRCGCKEGQEFSSKTAKGFWTS